MSNTIALNSTYNQPEQEIVEYKEIGLLQNIFFPTNESRDTFPTSEVVLEFDDGDLEAGVFCKKKYANGNTVTSHTKAFTPPRLAIEDTIDPLNTDRVLMEQICYAADGDRAEAYENLRKVKLLRQLYRAQRSLEKEIAGVLMDCGVFGTQLVDGTQPEGSQEAIDIAYYDERVGNEQRFSVGTAWGSQGATPYRDICKAVQALLTHGGKATHLLMSMDAWFNLVSDEEFNNQIKWIHTEQSVLNGKEIEDAQGVGIGLFIGVPLQLIVCSAQYKGSDGAMHGILPTGFVSVLSENCGRVLCGGSVHLAPNYASDLDPNGASAFVGRRGKFIASEYRDFDAQLDKIRLESRPLPAPRKLWQWITADVSAANNVGETVAGKPVVSLNFEKGEHTDAVIPADLANQVGGSAITLADATSATATAAGKSFAGYAVDGVKLTKSGAKYIVPNVDSEIVPVFE